MKNPNTGFDRLRDQRPRSRPAPEPRDTIPLLGTMAGRLLALFVIALVVIGAAAGVVAATVGRISGVVQRYTDVSIPPIPIGPQTTFVFDRRGERLTTLHAAENRTIVPLTKISPNLQHAVIAIEDRDFYHHGALDAMAIFRAAAANVSTGRISQGGSTITQQLVKNLFTSGDRTLSRKIHEAVLAVKLERQYSKNEILEKYLNTVYFGHGAYGAEAAAVTYFGIHASELKFLGSATLAGMIAAPGQFDPLRDRGATLARRNIVLQKMGEQGYITPEKAAKLEQRPLKVPGLHQDLAVPHPYFMQTVTQRLLHLTSYNETFRGGLRVRTTLDSRAQDAAEQAVAQHLPSPSDPSAALVAIDPTTGDIRALVGGNNFDKQKFNLATQAHRQTGSAAKTFTLTTAMEQGVSLSSIWVGPPHLTVDDPRCLDPTTGKPWEVSNAADGEGGTFTLKDAIAHSINTIFAQVVLDTGPDNVVDTMHTLGIKSKLEAVCSITLGTQAVTPLEMTNAYATLASGGIRHNTQVISTIRDVDGKLLWKPKTKGTRAIPENDAALVSYALRGVVESGTGTAATLPGRPVAGKTGTNQAFRDAWFCGYTPQLAACVWMGYRKGEIPMHDVEGVPEVFGGTIPAAIWHDFMSKAMEGLPVADFPTPDFSNNTLNPKHSITLPPPAPSPTATQTHSPHPSPHPTPTCSKPNCHTHTPGPTPSPSGNALVGFVFPLGGAALVGACAAGRRRRSKGRHRGPR